MMQDKVIPQCSNQYLFNPDKWIKEAIKDEDTAFSVLVRLDPHGFLRFHELSQKERELNKEEQDFCRQYRLFLSETHHFDDAYIAFILEIYRRIKKAKLWKGDFFRFVQTLHNEGYTFHEDAVRWLKSHGIELTYSQDGKAYKFCMGAINKGVWSFRGAVRYYMGDNPENEKSVLVDLSQNFMLIIFWPDEICSYNPDYDPSYSNAFEEFINLEQRAKDHIDAGLLEAVKRDDGYVFTPKVIMQWLLENTCYRPSPIWIEMLDLQHPNEQLTPQQAAHVVKEFSKKSPLTRKEKITRLKAASIPLIDEFRREEKRKPQHGEIVDMLVEAGIVPDWENSTITRYISYDGFNQNYQKGKKI